MKTVFYRILTCFLALRFTTAYGQLTWQKIDSIAYKIYVEDFPDSAILLYKKHLPAIKAEYSESSLPYLTFISHLGYAYNIKQRYTLCDSLYQYSIQKLKAANLAQTDIFCETVNNYFTSLFEQGKYLAAEGVYKKYLPNPDSVRSLSQRSTLFNNLACLYDGLGKSDEAIALFQKSLLILEEQNMSESEQFASTINNMALCYKRMGNYPMAEKLYEKAKEIRYEVIGEADTRYANTCNNIAALYSAQGKIQEAILMYQKVEKLHLDNGRKFTKEYAFVCNNLGAMYARTKNYKLAEYYYTTSKNIREKILGKNSQDYAQSCSNLASLYILTKKLDSAKKELKNAIEIIQKNEGKSGPQHIKYLHNQAEIYFAEKNFSSAESLLVDIIANAKKLFPDNHPQMSAFKKSLAKAYKNQNKVDLADKLYLEIIDAKIAEIKQNFSNLSQSDKESYIQRNLNDYLSEFYLHVALRHSHNPQLAQKAFDVANLTKGMVINSSNKVRKALLNSNDTSLTQTFLKWQNLQKEIVKITSMTLNEQKKRKVNLDSLVLLSNQYEKKLSYAADFKSIKENDNVSYADIQAKLSAKQAAIEIIRVQDEQEVLYLILILKKNCPTPDVVVIPGGQRLETEHLVNYKRSIRHKIHDPHSYNVFWKPIQERLQGIKKVYISNDGVYHLINLNTLQNPVTKAYVMDEIEITYLTNTKNLVLNVVHSNQKDTKKTTYLVGNPTFEINSTISVKPDSLRTFDNLYPLPGSEQEVLSIAKIIPNSTVIIGAQATESKIKEIVKDAHILHVATHGYFEMQKNDNPMFSMLNAGILLAGVVDYGKRTDLNISTEEDGKLTAFEIMNMELNHVELFTLSACETGVSIFNENGIYGLQRALKIAGAASIITSLWKVDDQATQLLMFKFYMNWQQKKMNKSSAFIKAQYEVRKQYPEPYYWGPFVMIQ
ncbi:MAG: CHAT domain-containing protein [Bacteroidia bacterium]|nr:CHAT domain-containing protein [Bacteroidia bacterium]MDW8302341.1 CHAT domain-containing tetratricopeptide repeat protein [Bacteroidia bacterium]